VVKVALPWAVGNVALAGGRSVISCRTAATEALGGAAGGTGRGVAARSYYRRSHQGQGRRGDTMRPAHGVTGQMRWLYGLEQPELTGATLAEGWGDGAVAD
jgi:hypothetical protein